MAIVNTQQNIVEKFLGRGLVFPMQLTPSGAVETETGIPLIRSCLLILLHWLIGTRYMLGEFGCHLENVLEQPNDELAINLIRTHITEAIDKWERRVELIDVIITVPPEKEYLLNITLHYRIKNTKVEDTFIFPYYSQLKY